jgi:hypothetical protein
VDEAIVPDARFKAESPRLMSIKIGLKPCR